LLKVENEMLWELFLVNWIIAAIICIIGVAVYRMFLNEDDESVIDRTWLYLLLVIMWPIFLIIAGVLIFSGVIYLKRKIVPK